MTEVAFETALEPVSVPLLGLSESGINFYLALSALCLSEFQTSLADIVRSRMPRATWRDPVLKSHQPIKLANKTTDNDNLMVMKILANLCFTRLYSWLVAGQLA